MESKVYYRKRFTSRWTEEILVITKVQSTSPVAHKVKELSMEEISGILYNWELQKTKVGLGDFYRVEKILQNKKNMSLLDQISPVNGKLDKKLGSAIFKYK